MTPDQSLPPARPIPRAHAAIAGTGRAGTSFLVQFLAECGLDVGPTSEYAHKRARAGLEHRLLHEDAPYVVKDPWLFMYCEKVDLSVVSIDALVVPMRDLVTAATSRVVQELMARPDEVWRDWPAADVYGIVPGGVLYSLDPVDEARILAVGFHRLIHWATARHIPLFLLEFPRCVSDGAYLVDTLWPWLGAHCNRETALRAFDAVADPSLVRAEQWSGAGACEPDGVPDSSAPTVAQLDRNALVELLVERDARLAEVTAELVQARDELAHTRDDLSHTHHELSHTRDELSHTQEELSQADERLAGRATELEHLRRQRDEALAQVDALRSTVSWRITVPLRKVRSLGRRPAS